MTEPAGPQPAPPRPGPPEPGPVVTSEVVPVAPARSGGSPRSDQPVRREVEVYRVTTAKTALSQEQRRRTKRYLISMSIRTVCFLAAVFAAGWLRWAFLVGAVVLPYVAVIMANAGRENDPFTGPDAPDASEPAGDIDLRELGDRRPDGGT